MSGADHPPGWERGVPGSPERRAASSPSEPDPLADWLTTSEVAAMAGIDRGSIRRYVWRGAMPEPLRKGGILLWRRSEIEAWLRARPASGSSKRNR